ncbi:MULTISPECIES: (2E,6E)-farnesyl diphosphate synthase [Ectothiorhodospira]|uniref:Farnesyl diphosphate synthase n=1 Tax=Ectothiorhodospira marina TaxID=1396821 RepID=A0A1H7NMT1_9GAMM|nr:farnesyl diphosphate synthase [Ectothiorhodospira marina]MCG5516311.1 (2E,6E)-farnesyl diphosphate synthase [Ectothiorhodospira sp. 9100]MCG5519310.1 (2E,6E)-farnesyl diphosphate synthase [Ectothiorhodospira sp. 9905]SEL24295.1 farnesyl diphosphate synthase [Ectothiorhodospira marina]
MESRISDLQQRVEAALAGWLPESNILPGRLHEGMRYSALDGGKRIRPVLAYATGSALGVPLDQLDGPACAVELIHVYSLVHDDLPAMDDDDLRRGKPTCHKAYDDATAILVGDALQALAFQILATDPKMVDDPGARLRMVDQLARASGSRGMVGGQAIDLGSAGKQLDIAELEGMHVHKTGALIRAAVLMGATSRPDVDPQTLEGLDRFAKCIGLAFQIRDDILDVEGDTQTLGKTQGADQALGKATYPAIIGLDASKQQARELVDRALDGIAGLDERADLLRWIARFIVERIN